MIQGSLIKNDPLLQPFHHASTFQWMGLVIFKCHPLSGSFSNHSTVQPLVQQLAVVSRWIFVLLMVNVLADCIVETIDGDGNSCLICIIVIAGVSLRRRCRRTTTTITWTYRRVGAKRTKTLCYCRDGSTKTITLLDCRFRFMRTTISRWTTRQTSAWGLSWIQTCSYRMFSWGKIRWVC